MTISSPPPTIPRSPTVSSARSPPSRDEMAAAAQARLASASSTLPGVSDEHKIRHCTNIKQAELEKLIDRGVIGANHYAEAEKIISTVLKIGDNILGSPDDPKYRSIKAASKVLTNNVLSIKGGQELIVALGFRKTVVDFVETWVFAKEGKVGGLDRIEVFRLGVAILKRKEVETKERSELANRVTKSAKEEGEERRRDTVASIEYDRIKVRERAAREAAARDRHRPPAPPSPVASTSRPSVEPEETEEDESDDDRATHAWSGEGNKLG